ncbi:MAG TPA: TetR/AcrR family transcriptional regulator [Stackebrandtia sp.]|uniref:TetR/AcrR family transcriptional regulator n=1 Tax=Stackebrandtia sp. TaxID=2023065 RepID=UPI002D33F9EF|nr:TetR/AcrR family transcriptional regulator [Stackebrandtia sp.]HZE38898.1 TetR/AcrR family transcriptional regulator [Stackebrandtia sp.]
MSTTPKTSYHHGNLRTELMEACLRLVDEEGIGAVSLRRVAREAGVSPGAPYHHFADRAALIAELTARGFTDLTARLRAVRAEAADPVTALVELLEAYVEFAGRHRAYFLLMFRPELSASDKHPDVQAAGDDALAVVAEAIEDCRRAGMFAAVDSDGLVVTLWSLAHGLAALVVDGKIDKMCLDNDIVPDELLSKVKDTVTALLSC